MPGGVAGAAAIIVAPYADWRSLCGGREALLLQQLTMGCLQSRAW